MPKKEQPKKEQPDKKASEITFNCKFCGKPKPLKEMMMLTRFFPPLIACRECEQKVR